MRPAGGARFLAGVLAAAAIGLPTVSSGLAAQTPSCDEAAWAGIVSMHLVRYPAMEIADLYKLIHQGVFGSEHAVPSRAVAEAWLVDELAGLDSIRPAGVGMPEPLFEPIAPDSAIVRVHLRPYLAAGGDPDRLLDAFVATANSATGSTEELLCVARVVGSLARPRDRAAEWASFVAARQSEGFPAGHHSEPYTSAYEPAYRVVARAYLRSLTPARDRDREPPLPPTAGSVHLPR